MKYGMAIVLSVLVAIALPISYSQTLPGPANPNQGPNTIAQYCPNGICHTNSTVYSNSTFLFGSFGNSTNGIHLNNSTLYGIQLDKTCSKLEQLGILSNCISYKYVQSFDTTNPAFTGFFANFNGWYHREPSQARMTWNFYTGKPIVMPDPDSDFASRAKMIYLTQPFTYISPNDNVTNHVRVEYHDRYVSPDCTSAIVATYNNNIPFSIWLINDTLHYLESDCRVTKFTGQSYSLTPTHPINYDTWNVKTTEWLDHFAFNGTSRIAQNCMYTWVKCDIPSDPYHTHDPKFGWN